MKDPYEDIVKKYPNLYRFTKYIGCGEGWYDLIDDLSSKLEKLIVEMDESEDEKPAATQIKEKFGQLRFYMTSKTEEMDELIEEAENKSARICESCGKKGEIKGVNWFYCRCETCDY